MTDFLIMFINILVTVFYVAILARVLLSWIPIGPDSAMAQVVQVVHQITEPILAPIRKVLPSMGMFDLSPMIAIILIFVVQWGLDSLLRGNG